MTERTDCVADDATYEEKDGFHAKPNRGMYTFKIF